MTETLETTVIETESGTTVIPDMFDEKNWKSTPTNPVTQVITPIVEEKTKDEEKPIVTETTTIVEEKPIEIVKEIEPIKFANDESEKVFNLLKEGKIDDVYSIISEQKKLSNVDKMPPADIIKLNLQYQNKDFTPQEIQELFEDTYLMPEKPVQAIDEEDDEFKPKLEKYEAQVSRIESRIKRDAKPATAELLKLSKEIVLPDIQKQATVNNEPTQEELEAQKVQAQQFLKSVDNATNELNGYQVTFKDEEVTIPVAYKLSKEEKLAIQPLIALSNSNGAEFLTKIGWLDENGNINPKKLAEDLPLILNKEAVLQKLVTEAGNKRHEASIKSIKNIDYSGSKSKGDQAITPEQARQGFENAFFI